MIKYELKEKKAPDEVALELAKYLILKQIDATTILRDIADEDLSDGYISENQIFIKVQALVILIKDISESKLKGVTGL